MNTKNIWVAAGDGELARVVELVEGDGLSANIPDDFSYTPMHAAASYGHIHVLEYLISKGGDVNITDDEGDTPLYTVENIETAKFLIEHGAVLDRTNNEGVPPIEHLGEEFPQVAAYLATLLPPSDTASTGPVNDVVMPSQHSQNAVSENLTNGLVERIQGLSGEMDDDALRRIVSESVFDSLTRGQSLQEAGEEEEHVKRRRLE